MSLHKFKYDRWMTPRDTDLDGRPKPDENEAEQLASANSLEDSLTLLESWSELHNHPEFWPEVCRKWADRIDDDEAMERLRPILNNLFGYAAARDGETVEIFREKMRRSLDNAGKSTFTLDRRGVVNSIGADASDILGFAPGESIRDLLLEPLPQLFEQATMSPMGLLSELFGRDGVRRLINVNRFQNADEEEATLIISICNVFLPAAAENYLRSKLSLTDAEIEILTLSIQRYNIDGIARKRSNSVNTIRTHIKNITSKLGCKNYNDVIVRTLEIIAYHQKDRPSALAEVGNLSPAHLGLQTLKLKRHKGQLEYSIYGDMKLRPLVSLHSIEYGYTPSAEFIAAARKAGYFILCPRRPGFGVSSHGGSVQEDASRIAETLELLNLENAVVMSFSTACPVAMALALQSDLISHTLLVNYAFNAKAKLKDVKPRWLKGLLDLCMASQASFNFASMITGNLIRISGRTGFYEKLYETCKEDLEYLRQNSDEFDRAASLLLAAERDTVRRELVGSFLFNPEVSEMLDQQPNIISVFGEHTHGVPLEFATREAAKLNAPFFVIENAGRNCVFQRPEAFFNILNDLEQPATARAG